MSEVIARNISISRLIRVPHLRGLSYADLYYERFLAQLIFHNYRPSDYSETPISIFESDLFSKQSLNLMTHVYGEKTIQPYHDK